MEAIAKQEYRFIDVLHELEQAIKDGFLQKDPNNPNNIVLYYTASEDRPEGWYSENILEVASDLFYNKKSYQEFKEVLARARKECRND